MSSVHTAPHSSTQTCRSGSAFGRGCSSAAVRAYAFASRSSMWGPSQMPNKMFCKLLFAVLLLCSSTAAGSRFIGISTGDRWLRPNDRMIAGSPVRMQDPGASPDWALSDAGLLVAKAKPALCIAPSACTLANSTLILAIPSQACMLLNGSRLIAPACQQLCAAPEGGEHDVQLARCSDVRTDAFRAV